MVLNQTSRETVFLILIYYFIDWFNIFLFTFGNQSGRNRRTRRKPTVLTTELPLTSRDAWFGRCHHVVICLICIMHLYSEGLWRVFFKSKTPGRLKKSCLKKTFTDSFPDFNLILNRLITFFSFSHGKNGRNQSTWRKPTESQGERPPHRREEGLDSKPRPSAVRPQCWSLSLLSQVEMHVLVMVL